MERGEAVSRETQCVNKTSAIFGEEFNLKQRTMRQSGIKQKMMKQSSVKNIGVKQNNVKQSFVRFVEWSEIECGEEYSGE